MQLNKHVDQGSILYIEQPQQIISVSENKHFRWLAFDNVIQSVMSKRAPWKLTLPHQTIALLPLLFFKPLTILELGLGGGNIARFFHHLNSTISFTSIEYNKTVINSFLQFFNPENITINIIEDNAYKWLQNSSIKDEVDWLICDVYQQQLIAFKETVALFESLTNHLTVESCLTINLPDASDTEVNLSLTVLKQLAHNHDIIYFHVPNYLNIIIHLLPKHWPINKNLKSPKNLYLCKRRFNHWKKFWQYGIETKI